jgi:hypothetical protein
MSSTQKKIGQLKRGTGFKIVTKIADEIDRPSHAIELTTYAIYAVPIQYNITGSTKLVKVSNGKRERKTQKV